MTPATARVAYADLDAHPLVGALEDFFASPADAGAAARLAAFLVERSAPPPALVAHAALRSGGPFARAARLGLDGRDRRLLLAGRELERLGELAHTDVVALLDRHGLGDAVPEGPPVRHELARPPEHRELLAALSADPSWGAMAGRLADFHHRNGIGPLAVHRVLRFGEGGLEGVASPDPTTLDDLEGGGGVRAPLAEDLARFAEGGTANDALLYGPPGTGKTATVRALAAAHAPTGLRLVQADPRQIPRLPELFALLAGEGPRCLVLLDDIVFDQAGRTDRALRAALEGDVSERPANLLVWATSNRMKLVRESRSEREDEIEEALARGEKAALATRFGRRVRFEPTDQDGYLRIVERLVRQRHGSVSSGTQAAALRFARAGHGLTPRTARQFVAGYRA